MKKLVPNPEYEKARYELALFLKDGSLAKNPSPPRFKTNPPGGLDAERLLEWVEKNKIPAHIEKDE